MSRFRSSVCALVAVVLLASMALAADELPHGSAPAPLEFRHFPDRLHAFIWRNWLIVDSARLAQVLGTSTENIRAVAESMGLPPDPAIAPEFRSRGYITIIRRNWHLLPYDQLLVLLDMTPAQLAEALREDDFLFVKLGSLKPRCQPLKYAPPDDDARQRAAQIRKLMRDTLGDDWNQPAPRQPFAFLRDFHKPIPDPPQPPKVDPADGLRYIYSYFGVFGDPLLDPELDPYPDELLARLADRGVNGVWLHVVLRQLVPGGDDFPEFGAGHEQRLANLRRLVQRARRFGIGVYLYMNEPRAMPHALFEKRPQMAGVREGDYTTLCTSNPDVRRWITDSLAYLFKSVPDLAGVFTITASENLTNCASHGQWRSCPRCKSRTPAAIIAEINSAIEAGVHAGNHDARVIVWDWGWGDDWAPDAIAALPKSVWYMSVSEWSLPVVRGGVRSAVGEYSISSVGPGPRATRHWNLARSAGLKTAAKVQLNNTWELSAVPYLPVLDLVARHCHNLASAQIDGMMLSWSLGGYPSPNLDVARRMAQKPTPAPDQVLDAIARERFGAAGAPHARRAWTRFSDAFREYPYDPGSLYTSPAQYGPSNLLFLNPTGYAATMIGFPYDDLKSWRGVYPPEIFAAQMEKVAAGWNDGLVELERAIAHTPPDRIADARAELLFARVAHLHFASVANQTRFVAARNALRDRPQPQAEQRQKLLSQLRAAATAELAAARELFPLARADSRIAFEASNHYYYLPHDLAEKVINCRHVLDAIEADFK